MIASALEYTQKPCCAICAIRIHFTGCLFGVEFLPLSLPLPIRRLLFFMAASDALRLVSAEAMWLISIGSVYPSLPNRARDVLESR